MPIRNPLDVVLRNYTPAINANVTGAQEMTLKATTLGSNIADMRVTSMSKADDGSIELTIVGNSAFMRGVVNTTLTISPESLHRLMEVASQEEQPQQ